MKAVITVIGKDCTGIIARVSGMCAESGVNILEITQSVLHGYFAMIMIVDISGLCSSFADFAESLSKLGEEEGLEIRALLDDIFNAMHKI